MSDGWQRDLYVKSSPIHGLGVFARRTFATGETILVRDERPVTPEHPLDEAAGEHEYHCDWLEEQRQVYLGFPERHVNHSCDPNAFTRFEDGRSSLVALRPIRPGEEIADHYGVNLWDGVAWDCNCGAQRCLGRVPGDFFSLPLDLKIELEPLLAAWFKEEHAAEYEAFLRESGLEEVLR
jgi:SET domain-containing protein